jgi:iron complex transport system substrate-binding protein
VVTLWSGTEDIQKKLDEFKIPYVLVYYSTNDEFKKGIELIGEVLGPKEKELALNFAKYYDSNIKKVADITDKLTVEKKKRVYYVAANPLNTEGKSSIVTSWINISGGVNVAAENGIENLTANVSVEDVIKWDPEVIIIRDAANKKLIMEDEKWKNISAVKNGRVYINPKGVNVWSARSADGALQPLWASKTIHPELFENLDIESETRYFYEKYYNYKVNDEELKDILYPVK